MLIVSGSSLFAAEFRAVRGASRFAILSRLRAFFREACGGFRNARASGDRHRIAL